MAVRILLRPNEYPSWLRDTSPGCADAFFMVPNSERTGRVWCVDYDIRTGDFVPRHCSVAEFEAQVRNALEKR